MSATFNAAGKHSDSEYHTSSKNSDSEHHTSSKNSDSEHHIFISDSHHEILTNENDPLHSSMAAAYPSSAHKSSMNVSRANILTRNRDTGQLSGARDQSSSVHTSISDSEAEKTSKGTRTDEPLVERLRHRHITKKTSKKIVKEKEILSSSEGSHTHRPCDNSGQRLKLRPKTEIKATKKKFVKKKVLEKVRSVRSEKAEETCYVQNAHKEGQKTERMSVLAELQAKASEVESACNIAKNHHGGQETEQMGVSADFRATLSGVETACSIEKDDRGGQQTQEMDLQTNASEMKTACNIAKNHHGGQKIEQVAVSINLQATLSEVGTACSIEKDDQGGQQIDIMAVSANVQAKVGVAVKICTIVNHHQKEMLTNAHAGTLEQKPQQSCYRGVAPKHKIVHGQRAEIDTSIGDLRAVSEAGGNQVEASAALTHGGISDFLVMSGTQYGKPMMSMSGTQYGKPINLVKSVRSADAANRGGMVC